jgi:hypothetical protein
MKRRIRAFIDAAAACLAQCAMGFSGGGALACGTPAAWEMGKYGCGCA